ncbi:hypothetical protein DYBT9623_05185 [Dyadobacter sp. CECT 9623]|uniref:Uncharacterized protein n=1 Tax=Dyadobacter linearis TaxID=2823330 RepID=A0ABM8UY05_9BACT|nr:DUF1259 domain-containing protein [Dyadobacter sp. CECT 9623]CAG5074498.1 hypothetical protein DYBT9623_05185 [Dyadobacter sp. CECT 9623]
MTNTFFSRRAWLKTGVYSTAAGLAGTHISKGDNAPAKTPSLTKEEIAAIEVAMGKKGAYDEGQAVHTTPLPRNDLKVTVKGEPVPTPFGFGGWVSIKRTVNGKSAVLMSDCVFQ